MVHDPQRSLSDDWRAAIVVRGSSSRLRVWWALACQLRRPDTPPGRMIEPQLVEPAGAGVDRRERHAGPTARDAGARTHRPARPSSASGRGTGRGPRLAMVVGPRSLPRLGTAPRAGGTYRSARRRFRHRAHGGGHARGLARRVRERTPDGRDRGQIHGSRTRGSHAPRATDRARVSGAPRRPGCRRGSTPEEPRVRGTEQPGPPAMTVSAGSIRHSRAVPILSRRDWPRHRCRSRHSAAYRPRPARPGRRRCRPFRRQPCRRSLRRRSAATANRLPF